MAVTQTTMTQSCVDVILRHYIIFLVTLMGPPLCSSAAIPTLNDQLRLECSNLTIADSSTTVDMNICQHRATQGGINVMSICPWHYEEDVQRNRCPARIVRAVLTCGEWSGCLQRNPRRGGDAVSHTAMRCLPVLRHVQVVNSTVEADGRVVLRHGVVAIPVAYTCAW